MPMPSIPVRSTNEAASSRSRRCMRFELLVLCALTLPVAADPLADLRGAVARLTAKEPLTVAVELHRSRHSRGRFLSDDFDGAAAVEVFEDANGMRVGV